MQPCQRGHNVRCGANKDAPWEIWRGLMLEIWRWRFTRGKTGGPALQCGPSGFHVPQRRAIALGQVRSGYDSWPSRNRRVRLGPLFMHNAFNRRVHQPGRIRNASPLKSSYGILRVSATRRTASRAAASLAPEPRGAAPSTSKITMSPTRQCPFQLRTTFDYLIVFMSRPLSSRRRTTRRLTLIVSGSEAGHRA